jgi:hypothetical protein
MSKIKTFICDSNGIFAVTEDGEHIESPVIATDGGYSILNHDRGDRWAAIQIADYGDNEAEVFDHYEEGDTFTDENGVEFVVRRTDNAGSLKWDEA